MENKKNSLDNSVINAFNSPVQVGDTNITLNLSKEGSSFSSDNLINEKITAEEDTEDKFILSFWREYSSFIGREKELETLQGFIADERPSLWTTVSGTGGIGKSRLILEFYNRLDKGIWDINYIEKFLDNPDERFNNLVKNILIIIDETSVEINNASEAIKSLATINSDYKIRIIFIGRTAQSDLSQLLITNPKANFSHFDDVILKGLEVDDYLKLIDSVAATKNFKIKIERGAIISIQQNLDPLRRPIFGTLIGLALADNRNISNWVIEDLLNYYYEAEIRKLESTFNKFKDLDKHLNLIALLFILREPSIEQIRNILSINKTWLPKSEKLNQKFLYNFFSEIESKNRFYKLYPDILSTYFVLKRIDWLKSQTIKYGLPEAISAIELIEAETMKWIEHEGYEGKYAPTPYDNPTYNCVGRFKSLLLQDFPEKSFTIELLKANKNNFSTPFDSHRIINTIINFNITDPQKINTYENILENITLWDDYGSINSLMEFKLIKIRLGIDIDDNYEFIRVKSDEFETSPWIGRHNFIDTKNIPIGIELAYEIEYQLKSQGDYELDNIVWEAIPRIEAMAIEFLLLEKTHLIKYDRNILLERLTYLKDKWTDPRIMKSYINTLVYSGLFSKPDIYKVLQVELLKVLETPQQVRPLNTLDCISEIYWIAMIYMLRQSNFIKVVEYYPIITKHMLNAEIDWYNRNAIDRFIKKSQLIHKELLSKGLRHEAAIVSGIGINLDLHLNNTILTKLPYEKASESSLFNYTSWMTTMSNGKVYYW